MSGFIVIQSCPRRGLLAVPTPEDVSLPATSAVVHVVYSLFESSMLRQTALYDCFAAKIGGLDKIYTPPNTTFDSCRPRGQNTIVNVVAVHK